MKKVTDTIANLIANHAAVTRLLNFDVPQDVMWAAVKNTSRLEAFRKHANKFDRALIRALFVYKETERGGIEPLTDDKGRYVPRKGGTLTQDEAIKEYRRRTDDLMAKEESVELHTVDATLFRTGVSGPIGLILRACEFMFDNVWWNETDSAPELKLPDDLAEFDDADDEAAETKPKKKTSDPK